VVVINVHSFFSFFFVVPRFWLCISKELPGVIANVGGLGFR
jgi:hypothetical protein